MEFCARKVPTSACRDRRVVGPSGGPVRIAAQHVRSVPKTPHETSAKVACKTATVPYCSIIQGEKYRKVIAPLESASPEATPLEPALH